MNEFEYIRTHKNPQVRRNGVVTYHGQRYRIASAEGGHLKLRSEIWVHPTDGGLEFTSLSGVDKLNAEVAREKMLVQALSSVKDANYQRQRSLDHHKSYLQGLQMALQLMNCGGK